MMTGSPEHTRWYARRNGTVRGPFADEYVSRYILLGRIRLNDELSRDGSSWQPVTDFTHLLPEELSRLESWDDYHKLVMARIKYDERVSERRQSRTAKIPGRERRTGKVRRSVDNNTEFFRYLLINISSDVRNRENDNSRQSFRVFLLMALLISLVVAYFSLSMR
jgi:hypothetical protein